MAFSNTASLLAALSATQSANAGFQGAARRRGPGPKKIRRRKRKAARRSARRAGLGATGAAIGGI